MIMENVLSVLIFDFIVFILYTSYSFGDIKALVFVSAVSYVAKC